MIKWERSQQPGDVPSELILECYAQRAIDGGLAGP